MLFKNLVTLGFFQLISTCPFHLEVGTCSLNILLNSNFNFHTPWNSLIIFIIQG
jgi:hypothetical protein